VKTLQRRHQLHQDNKQHLGYPEGSAPWSTGYGFQKMLNHCASPLKVIVFLVGKFDPSVQVLDISSSLLISPFQIKK
jgi:hypothetical protein